MAEVKATQSKQVAKVVRQRSQQVVAHDEALEVGAPLNYANQRLERVEREVEISQRRMKAQQQLAQLAGTNINVGTLCCTVCGEMAAMSA